MLIRLEAQAVTTADLGQEHGILARLQFSLLLLMLRAKIMCFGCRPSLKTPSPKLLLNLQNIGTLYSLLSNF